MDKVEVLKKYFGYPEFRKGQEEIIENILKGNDVLGIMPTGAGKSICYQVPSLVSDGITIVVSPLISLMRDQVNALITNGIKAAFINSSLTQKQLSLALENAKMGAYKIIYVAPERLDTAEFMDFAVNADIFMITIDEAHCISQWGQDFRPSYLKICDFIDNLPKRPVVSAFTATATIEVKEDIINILNLKNLYTVSTGFDRENLYFEVQKPNNKYENVLKYLANNSDKSGIIYCLTRKVVEEVCQKLMYDGYNATRYHAGLPDCEKTQNQDDFLFDRKTIMVATNAFGMGIDKSNVSYVIHYNMPKNIESYYQEAGRAGRDSMSADCILMYGGNDVVLNKYFIDNMEENEDNIYNTNEKVKENERYRLNQMIYYCNTKECLRQYILDYFGDTQEVTCNNCSNCNKNYEYIDITQNAQKIMSCISRLNGKFGIKMIIDILRGSKSQKIINLSLHKNKSYGIMAELSENTIRECMDYLVLNDYIGITNSKFGVVILKEKSKDVLFGNEALSMKYCPDEVLKTNNKTKKMQKYEKYEINNQLFFELKDLRKVFANKKGVPAFVIFSDSSLIDMCVKMPQNEKEFLTISGVGEIKMREYAKEFLEIIGKYSHNAVISETKSINTTDLIRNVKENFVFSDSSVTISEIADLINSILIKNSDLKISPQKIANFLFNEGFLEIENIKENKKNKIPTEKGTDLGIVSVNRTNKNFQSYKINYYNKNTQEYIVNNIEKIIFENKV